MPELLKSVLFGFVVFWILILIGGTIGGFEVLLFLLISLAAGSYAFDTAGAVGVQNPQTDGPPRMGCAMLEP